MNDNDESIIWFGVDFADVTRPSYAIEAIVIKDIDYSALRRGYQLLDFGDGPIAWPNCEIADCENGICFHMSKSLCYPHGIEFGAFTKAEFETNRLARLKVK